MKKILTICFLTLLTGRISAQESKFDQIWNDPQIEERITSGIENNRKGWFTINVKDYNNKPLKDASVKIEQQSHEFLFGANIFMLDGYPTEEMNKKYEDAFAKIFNYASVPFYWKDVEPERGRYRYDANSPVIFRRPPPDRVVEFCKSHNITMKGHTLVWDSPTASLPDWAPGNRDSLKILIQKRIESIAGRYKNDIPYWDVANEATSRKVDVVMPHDYVFDGFKEAEKYFLPQTHLIYNEIPEIFRSENYKEEYSPLYLLLQTLVLRGAKVDGIGLQFHLFEHVFPFQSLLEGKGFSPKAVFQVLDLYGQFGVPMNISEITFPSLPAGPEGLKNQEKITRNYYRLFFSHPAMEAITWWNVPDGKSWGTEGNLKPGLLDENLDPKPSYKVLDELINKEWKTNLSVKISGNPEVKFKGFYGTYKVTITQGRKVAIKYFVLSKNNPNVLDLKLDL